MDLLKMLFGPIGSKKQPRAPERHAHSQLSHPASQNHSQPHSQSPNAIRHATRKDMLRVVLRETLTHNGIPLTWVGADVLTASSRGQEPGVHVRLLIKHWEPLLMIHGVAFQHNFEKRLLSLDPLAMEWLMGMSWQFALQDESACPALPHPGAWTSPPKFVPARPAHSGEAQDTAPSDPEAEAKADLQRLFAARDADHARHAAANTAASFAPTEPSKL